MRQNQKREAASGRFAPDRMADPSETETDTIAPPMSYGSDSQSNVDTNSAERKPYSKKTFNDLYRGLDNSLSEMSDNISEVASQLPHLTDEETQYIDEMKGALGSACETIVENLAWLEKIYCQNTERLERYESASHEAKEWLEKLWSSKSQTERDEIFADIRTRPDYLDMLEEFDRFDLGSKLHGPDPISLLNVIRDNPPPAS